MDVVKALIKAGADINAKNEDGRIALDYFKYKGYDEEEISLLLEEAMKKVQKDEVRQHIEQRKEAHRLGKEKRTMTPDIGAVKRKKALEK